MNALQCFACGKSFRSAIAEARHRHNWPVLCTRNKRFAAFMAEDQERQLEEIREVLVRGGVLGPTDTESDLAAIIAMFVPPAE